MVVSAQIWQDRAMRQGWVWAVMVTAVWSFAACSQEAVGAKTPDDVLVLEVGGDHGSLRASLVALGREVAPARDLMPSPLAGADLDRSPAPAQELRSDGPIGSESAPEPAPGSAPESAPEQVAPPEEPQSEWVIVSLPAGETLTDVARRHLGDGRRFAELLEWNDWTELQARRLPVNQKIKIQRSQLR